MAADAGNQQGFLYGPLGDDTRHSNRLGTLGVVLCVCFFIPLGSKGSENIHWWDIIAGDDGGASAGCWLLVAGIGLVLLARMRMSALGRALAVFALGAVPLLAGAFLSRGPFVDTTRLLGTPFLAAVACLALGLRLRAAKASTLCRVLIGVGAGVVLLSYLIAVGEKRQVPLVALLKDAAKGDLHIAILLFILWTMLPFLGAILALFQLRESDTASKGARRLSNFFVCFFGGFWILAWVAVALAGDSGVALFGAAQLGYIGLVYFYVVVLGGLELSRNGRRLRILAGSFASGLGGPPPKSIESRIKEVDDLFEKGLISDDERQATRKRLLDSL